MECIVKNEHLDHARAVKKWLTENVEKGMWEMRSRHPHRASFDPHSPWIHHVTRAGNLSFGFVNDQDMMLFMLSVDLTPLEK